MVNSVKIMGFKERQQKHKEEFRAEILKAAVALFAEEGYAKFSMRKLAARIGYSPTTIYLYFRDKDDLLLHICENLYAALLQEMQELRTLPLPPEQILKATYLSYIRYNLANPEQYKVVFFSNPYLYGRPEDYFARDTMSNRCWRNMCETIDACMQSGYFRPLDRDTLAIVLWSAMHGLVSSLIFTKDFPMPDPDVMAEMLLDGLLNGYRA
ncbi:TetR/AcrR family transcriptional regulator [Trichlorobacter ammonificans]|nr:TetR/AcrR family transcriptional regulator [Trichlorobacter ammonificans]